MTDDCLLPFDLAAIQRREVTADFAGGTFSSDGGLVLLREAERPPGLTERLASCTREWREAALVVHTLSAMLRLHMFASDREVMGFVTHPLPCAVTRG